MNVIVVVRGKLRDLPEQTLREAHDALLGKLEAHGRALGNVGHRAYFNAGDHGELMVIDSWTNPDGARELMSAPALAEELGTFFDSMPEVTIWTDTCWNGYQPDS